MIWNIICIYKSLTYAIHTSKRAHSSSGPRPSLIALASGIDEPFHSEIFASDAGAEANGAGMPLALPRDALTSQDECRTKEVVSHVLYI